MQAGFLVDLIEDDRVVNQAYGDNIILDAGLVYLTSGSSSGLFSSPTLHIGSSDYPPQPEHPGNLAPLWSTQAEIFTAQEDSGEPYVFFTVSTKFGEDDGVGAWREISFNGWNRSLFTAPSTLLDGPTTYAITSYNASGESFPSTARTVNLVSPAMIGPVRAIQGLASMPSKNELLNPGALSDTISIHMYTLTWAINVTGSIKWAAAAKSDSRDLGGSISIRLKRDTTYYANFNGSIIPLPSVPSGDGEIEVRAPGSGPSEYWRLAIDFKGSTYPKRLGDGNWQVGVAPLQTEEEFWGTGQEMEVSSGSFGAVHQAYYKVTSTRLGNLMPFQSVALPEEYGYNPDFAPAPGGPARYAFDFINAPPLQTDPTFYPSDRGYHKAFTNFWGTNTTSSFRGEVFEAPGEWRLTLYKGAEAPGSDDLSEVQVYEAGTTGGVFGEWAHQAVSGPGGRSDGYRVYKKKPDNSWGLLFDYPVTWVTNGVGVLVPTGQTHFWDRGEVAPTTPMNSSFSSPRAPAEAGISIDARSGMLPKPIMKTDLMRGRINTQIFFYDANSDNATKMSVLPALSTMKAGETVALEAKVLNDYDQELLGHPIIWSAPLGGTINPSGAMANFSTNVAGVYAAAASSDFLSAAGQVTVRPADKVTLIVQEAIAEGGSAADVEADWNPAFDTLTVTLPRLPDPPPLGTTTYDPGPPPSESMPAGADIHPDATIRVPIMGIDAFNNNDMGFPRNWSMDGTSQRAVLGDGSYAASPVTVDGAVFKLTGDGNLQVKAPGSATIEVREILDGNLPSPVTKTFTVTFAWR